MTLKFNTAIMARSGLQSQGDPIMVRGKSQPARGGKSGGRGKRTPGLNVGAVVENDWSLTDAQWLEVGTAYCMRAKLGMLAKIATDMEARAQAGSVAGLSAQAAAKQQLGRARMAFEKAAREAELSGVDMAAIGRLTRRYIYRVERLTRAYIARENIERKATGVGLVNDWLDGVSDAAKAFALAYESPLDAPARSAARADIERNLSRRNWGEDGRLYELVSILRDVAHAAHTASSDMADEETVVSGDAWNGWIEGLTALCSSKKLPTGAKSELQKSGAPSGFVSLIMALQLSLPESLRPHKCTVGATAKAIRGARKSARDRSKARDDGEAEELARQETQARAREEDEIRRTGKRLPTWQEVAADRARHQRDGEM